MVEPHNDNPCIFSTDEDVPTHLEIVRLGALPLILYTVAALLCGGLLGGGLVFALGAWRGWWCA